MKDLRKIRVLHVTGAMNRAGTETWLMNLYRNIDRSRFQFDFLVHSNEPGAYDDEIRSLGGDIIVCETGLAYPLRFMREVHKRGPYDVIHSHIHHFSGVILALAAMLGVPVRIAHSHSDTSKVDIFGSLGRRTYLRCAKASIAKFATHKLAVSELAAPALFGADWNADDKCQLLYCGIDLAHYTSRNDDGDLRAALGMSRDSLIVGHVARFEVLKNHAFLIEIATILKQKAADVSFLLVGDGPLRQEIERSVHERGLDEMFVFTGIRDDIPQLLLGALDIFVLPSQYEGLGLAAVEAQAAGLPTLLSATIPQEASVVKELVEFLSIDDPLVWAQRIMEIKNAGSSFRQETALAAILSSPFNIHQSIEALETIYTCASRA